MKMLSNKNRLIGVSLTSFTVLILCTSCQQTGTKSSPPAAGPAQAATVPQSADERIRQQVTKALKTTEIKAAIRVEVKNQLVALTGEVASIDDRMRLVEAAKSVPGVIAVVRYIDVHTIERRNGDIEKDIRFALERNPATQGINPVVSVNNGVVALAGTGSDWQVKFLARRIVENVKGVREVLDPMCLPYEASPDYSVQKEIMDRFETSRPAFDHVSVEAKSGRVLLKGSVQSLQDKLRAISAAYVDRVRSVGSSELLVDSTSTGVAGVSVGPSDEDIKKVIEIAFAHDPRIAPSKPQLDVVNGTATLTGSTFDLKAISIAGLLAKQIPGVKEVRNNLSVDVRSQLSDKQLTATLRDAFLSDPNVDLYQLEVAVDHGRAQLRGTTNTMREKWRAEDIAMCTRGIVSIDNQLEVSKTPEPAVISHTLFPSRAFNKLWWVIPVADARSTEALKAAVERQLHWSPFVDVRTITVGVDSGVVTLTGQTRSIAEKKAAEDETYEAGATRVENNLEVIGEKTPIPPSS